MTVMPAGLPSDQMTRRRTQVIASKVHWGLRVPERVPARPSKPTQDSTPEASGPYLQYDGEGRLPLRLSPVLCRLGSRSLCLAVDCEVAQVDLLQRGISVGCGARFRSASGPELYFPHLFSV
jgi:hypothetical protein